MGLARAARAPQKPPSLVKDKFHLKRADDTAFLQARNARCAAAAALLQGRFV